MEPIPFEACHIMHSRPPVSLNEFKRPMRLLLTQRFGTYYIATPLPDIGAWSQQFAEPWLLLNLGASFLLIGLDSFVRSAPVWHLILAVGRRWLRDGPPVFVKRPKTQVHA